MGTRNGLLVAAIALAGCAPSEMSIFIGSASFLDDTCAVDGDTSLAGGSLNILGSTSPGYVGHFGVQSDLQAIDTQVGTDLLASGSRNDFLADTVITTYSVFGAGAGALPQAQRRPIYFVVPPGATGDNSSIQFNMLSTNAATELVNLVPVGSVTVIDLLVNFQFEGRLRSQPDSPLTRFRTSAVTFPIRVRNTNPNCPAATPTVVVTGPCGNSQESFTFACQ